MISTSSSPKSLVVPWSVLERKPIAVNAELVPFVA